MRVAVFSGSVSNGKDRPACVIGWEVEESTPSSGAGLTMNRVASVATASRGATDSMLTYVSSGLKNSLHRLSLIAGTIFEVLCWLFAVPGVGVCVTGSCAV